jgi:hypothetical protein
VAKETSAEPIRLLRAISEVLERSGNFRVRVVVTTRPGYIVYEDEYQVVAEPFNSTITK